jgi:hypothetical protein
MVKIYIVASSTMALYSQMSGINVTKGHGGCIFDIEVTHVSHSKISECIRKCLIWLPLLNNEKKRCKLRLEPIYRSFNVKGVSLSSSCKQNTRSENKS